MLELEQHPKQMKKALVHRNSSDCSIDLKPRDIEPGESKCL